MSYAEAKEIALLRLELRTSWERGDHSGIGLTGSTVAPWG